METKKGMITGIIRPKGYGFVRDLDDSKEYFFIAAGVIRPDFKELKEGTPVSFVLTEFIKDNEKKIKAIGITAINGG